MQVEVATTDSFKTIHSGVFVDAMPESDFTAKALLEGLPSGQDIFYRVRFQDLSEPTIVSAPVTGRFRTAPADRRSVSFVWSGDTAGQGWGIDEARGGMRGYATMLKNQPDFFIHNGDTVYADGPIAAEVKLPDGIRTSRPKRNRHPPRLLRSSAAISNTTCWIRSCAHSTPQSRCLCNGTITRFTTTGGPVSRCQPTSTARPITNRAMRCCSRHAPAAPSTNICRCA
jgi:hypothetical protein